LSQSLPDAAQAERQSGFPLSLTIGDQRQTRPLVGRAFGDIPLDADAAAIAAAIEQAEAAKVAAAARESERLHALFLGERRADD
jgi:hypothetical protein